MAVLPADSSGLRLLPVPSEERRPRLTDADIETIAERLRGGEYLDEYLKPLLFRQPKEIELDYAAKEPVSRALADTMAVPLQASSGSELPDEGVDQQAWSSATTSRSSRRCWR